MKVILDTNIVISALIKNSTTRKIIVGSNFDFYYPEESFLEIRKYKQLILEKSGMSESEFNELLSLLLTRITIVPLESIQTKLKEASEIFKKVDPDDFIFIATALSIENSIIWSNDSDFDRQDKIVNFKTKDIIDLLSEK